MAGSTPQLKPRPLSPHLGIYRLTMTMAMSVAHRVTGAALYFGTLLLAWWLIAAASGSNAYAMVGAFMASWIGRLIMFGYTWALIHHALGGVRHLIWDLGYGLDEGERDVLAFATLIGSIGITIVLWVIGFLVMSGPR